jgi:outer membrane receptor protein involved in Fe transport
MIQDTPPAPPAVIGELVVKPARLPAAASDAAFSVVQINPAEIEAKGRIDQALAQVPGVSLFRRTTSATANPTTQGISLRSVAPSGAGRTLVTLDGVPQNDPFGGWVIWASVPPELVDSITLVRGGGAGPYGAGALTGVIAINERATDGLVAEFSGGSENTQRGSAVIEGKVGAIDILAAGSGSRTDGFIPVRAGRGAADTYLSMQDWNVALRANAEVGDSVLSLRAGAYDERRGSGIGPGAADASGASASITLARAPTAQTFGYRLQAWVRASDLYNSTYSTSGLRTTATLANIQLQTPSTGIGFNGALRSTGGDFQWELGADIRSAEGETRERIGPLVAGVLTKDRFAGGNVMTAGVYAEGARTFGDLLLTGGARLDYWQSTDAHRVEHTVATGVTTLDSPSPDRDGYVPTARLGVRKPLGDGVYLRSAAYAGFRPPTLNELHRPFRVGNDITEANPSLEPERLYGVEGAIGRDADRYSASATVFYNEVDKAVTNVTIAQFGGVGGTVPGFPQAGFIPANGALRQRQNAGTITAWGVEAEAAYKVTDQFTVHVAGAYTDAQVDGGTAAPQLTGLRPAQAPQTTVTAALEWKPITTVNLSARARYESARFEDDLNSRVLRAATVMDLRAAWQVTKGHELWASVDNVLDDDVATGQTLDGTTSYGAPRTFMVGLTIRR